MKNKKLIVEIEEWIKYCVVDVIPMVESDNPKFRIDTPEDMLKYIKANKQKTTNTRPGLTLGRSDKEFLRTFISGAIFIMRKREDDDLIKTECLPKLEIIYKKLIA